MRNSLIILIILSVGFYKINAQSNFRDGYIVTLTGDTIHGQIDFRRNAKNYKSCRFRQDNTITTYSPEEIQAYGNPEVKFFIASIPDDAFVELLVKGEMSLYKHKNTYIIQKNNDEKYMLEKKPASATKTTGTENQWKGIIRYLLSDCQENMERSYENLQLEEKDLTELVIEYNHCKGQESLVCKESLPWSKISIGVSASLNYSTLHVKRPERPWIVNGIRLNEMYEYMSETYTLMYTEAGLVFTFMSPRKHERLSVRSGLYFNKSEYKAHVDLETRYTIESHDTYINLATLSIPFSIVYAIPLGKYSLSVQPGIQCQYFLKNDTRVLGEIINIYAPDINKDDIAFEMYKFTIGSSCGLAIARSFKNFTMETMVKHNYFPDYNKEEGLKVLNSNIGISFIISPSFK